MVRGTRMRMLGLLCLLGLLGAAPQAEAPVADAAMRGDVETVRALVKRGADVNAAQGDGMTALHWAARMGDAALAEVLLSAGARTDAATRNGAYTALHLASRTGSAEVVRRLLKAGADPAAVTSAGGTTALHFAAGAGSAEAVAALLEHGADVNAREKAAGQTPLMWAAAGNHVAAVGVLLQRGAGVALATHVVDFPVVEAVDRMAHKRRDEVLREFREAAGVGEGESWRPTPEQVQAAVQAAQEVQRSLTTVDALEDTPASSDEGFDGYTKMVGKQGGMTALLHAVREGHEESVMALLAAGADVNQVSEGDRTSPLLMAMLNGHFDLGLKLMERGADPNLSSEAGTTPLFAALNLHWAPKARYPQQLAYTLQEATYLDVMRRLLEAGADPNVRLTKHLWYMSYNFDLLGVDTRGATPFWRAAYATDVEAMKLLIAHGADPNVPTMAPAPRRGRGRGAVPTTTAAGAKPKLDPSGLPPIPEGGPGIWPLHAASGVGYGEGYAGNAHRHVPDGWLPAVKYLVEEIGVDINARDHNGYNAVHHAAARGDNELIQYLVEKGGDVMAVSRRGQTTADMANGPYQRVPPFPETVKLLESLGSKNNHRCMSC
jgi:ankyrin repeat protein